ncbi:hypothetical protein [Ammoniphilus sp. YIM 78166]|uniref:hypothetical protein n=1 Tax=Ammoniphilus sp. YIM 78166 TaxID=1644106 RepID=UPI0010704D96|nr:hypothetical protein [Ammoniphilus sp. YIM 78166]
MIKSFLKKVFSSNTESVVSEEHSASPETAQDTLNSNMFEETTKLTDYTVEEVIIQKEWIEKHLTKDWSNLVHHCYESALQDLSAQPRRIRIRLEEAIIEQMDAIFAKRLGKYLHLCEQEVVEFTYFLDKLDPHTMEIYKTYALPQRVSELNGFLQERCFMIYETAEALMRDYHQEIEQYFESLEIPMGENFFEEFEQWRYSVLQKHEEEEQQLASTTLSVQRNETMMIKVSREEVENENIHQLDHYMAEALRTPESAKSYEGSLLFSFYGYAKDGELLDLMGRKEIKDWASLLVEKHPHIFYFLNNEDYPMTRFLTSLVVTTEVEDDAVYYNEEELEDFQAYIQESLSKLATWLGEDELAVLHRFNSHFQ